MEVMRRFGGRSPVWGGAIVAVLAVVVLGLVLALVLHYTSLPEAYLGSYALAVVTLSVFFGSFVAARVAENRGLLHGILVAGVFLLLALAAALIGHFGFALSSFIKYCAVILLAGILGGIVGVSCR